MTFGRMTTNHTKGTKMRILTTMLLVGLAGCGSNVGARVSLADAEASCLEYDRSLTPASFLGILSVLEAARNDGLREGEFLGPALSECEDWNMNLCVACIGNVAAVVWR